MPKFKIYAGLSGGFGGAHYHCTDEFIDHADAERYARELAMEEYESYGGYHGLYTWDSMRQEIADELGTNQVGVSRRLVKVLGKLRNDLVA